MRARISRRRFIQQSAAAAAPLVVPASYFGQNAPSNRLPVGFIGLGKMGFGHFDRFTDGRSFGKEAQIQAVCDVHATRRELGHKTARERGNPDCTATADYREVIGRKDIEAVFIATPDHWHATIAIEAVKAGKDVYCEKPLTLTIHEAKLLIDAVRMHKRVFQVGSQQRSEGPFRNVCDYVRNGRLGKIKAVNVAVGPPSKWCDLPDQATPPGVDWDRWLGPAPQRGYNERLCRPGKPSEYPFNPGWREYREYSGGFVTDWGAHHFDITQWALGMDESGPSEIIPPEKEDSEYGTKLIYRGSPVGEEIVVTHAQRVWSGPGKDGKIGEAGNGIEIVGEKGRIFVDRGKAVSEPDTLLKEPLAEGDKKLFKSPGHLRNWMDCIKSREKPLCDVEVGSRSVTVCHLVNLAIWNRRKLKWDPKAWEFPGDAEANKWRDRERRAPYVLPTV